jgi:hypothetical protein
MDYRQGRAIDEYDDKMKITAITCGWRRFVTKVRKSEPAHTQGA